MNRRLFEGKEHYIFNKRSCIFFVILFCTLICFVRNIEAEAASDIPKGGTLSKEAHVISDKYGAYLEYDDYGYNASLDRYMVAPSSGVRFEASEPTYLKITLTEATEWLSFAGCDLYRIVGDTPIYIGGGNLLSKEIYKIALVPGKYELVLWCYSDFDISSQHIGENVGVCAKYSFSKCKKTSFTYNVGDTVYVGESIDFYEKDATYKSSKKNKVKWENGIATIIDTGKFSLTVSRPKYKAKYIFNIPEPDFWEDSKERTITAGSQWNYLYIEYSDARIFKWESSDESVLTVGSDVEFVGLQIIGKKAGTVTVTGKYGKTKISTTVTVLPNEYHNEDIKINPRNYEEHCYVEDLILKYNSDGSMTYSAYLINNQASHNPIKMKWVRVELYAKDGETLIAKQKFENRTEVIDYGDYCKFTFTIDKNNVYESDAYLVDGVQPQWYWNTGNE